MMCSIDVYVDGLSGNERYHGTSYGDSVLKIIYHKYEIVNTT